VAKQTRTTALRSPAAIAIHDNRNMSRTTWTGRGQRFAFSFGAHNHEV
jgi:hypothetical protein